jgi:hypothetical protein
MSKEVSNLLDEAANMKEMINLLEVNKNGKKTIEDTF